MIERTEKNDEFWKTLRQLDPSTVLYNALIPFSVAALEFFFGQVFKTMLKYSPSARAKMAKESRKIEIADAVSIAEGTKTIEDIVSSWYTFQNFDAVHKAFLDWHGIDFWQVIRREMDPGSNVRILSDVLNEIVDRRHGVIHRFEFDLEMDKESVVDVFKAIQQTICVFTEELEREKLFRFSDLALHYPRSIHE
jgi:hypothetical protein